MVITQPSDIGVWSVGVVVCEVGVNIDIREV